MCYFGYTEETPTGRKRYRERVNWFKRGTSVETVLQVEVKVDKYKKYWFGPRLKSTKLVWKDWDITMDVFN